MPDDFSDILSPGEFQKLIKRKYFDICSKCQNRCCSYITTPVSQRYPVSVNLDDESIVALKKGLVLHGGFRKHFISDLGKILTHFGKLGFGQGLQDFVKKNGYSIEAIIQAFWKLDTEIDRYNRKIFKEDPENKKGMLYTTCLFCLPDTGCIMGEYRPYTCKTVNRKCFNNLNLNDLIVLNVYSVEGERLFQYIKSNLSIGRDRVAPFIIIGADEGLRSRIIDLFKRKSAHYKEFSYIL